MKLKPFHTELWAPINWIHGKNGANRTDRRVVDNAVPVMVLNTVQGVLGFPQWKSTAPPRDSATVTLLRPLTLNGGLVGFTR